MMPKKLMIEEDIKLQYITPALTKKWNIRKISMEAKVTDGKVNLKGNLISRGTPKRADYLLHISDNNPIAVVEAKDNKHSVSYGLQQAMAYAQMLDLPFAYSSNGDGFAEHPILHKNGLAQDIQDGYDWLIQALRQTVGNVTAVAGGREIADHIVPPLAAASRWRQISAQLGSLLSFSAKSFSAPGTSMFWGHIRVHWPHPMQAVGFLSSGMNSIRMATFTAGENRSSL